MRISLKEIIFSYLAIIIFLIPIENMTLMGGQATLLRYLGFGIVPLFFVDIFNRKKLYRWSIEQWIFFIFVFWVILSMTWSYSFEATATLILTYISLLFFVWLIISYIDSLKKISMATVIFLVGCLVSLFLGRYSSADWVLNAGYMRYGGGGMNYNDYAFILAFGCVISFMHIFLSRSRLVAGFFFIIAIVMLAGIISTYSRAGFLAVAILFSGLLYFYWMSFKRSFYIFILVCICAGVLSLLIPDVFWARIMEGSSAETFISRKNMWESGFGAWKSQPITGVGAGAFVPATILSNNRLFLVAHNTFISVLVELGVVGLGLFVFLYFSLLRIGWQKFVLFKTFDNHKAVYMYFIGFMGLLIFIPAFLSLTFEYKKVLWFAIALAISCRRVLVNEKRS
ncbi:MAG: O-antigen ligase family protein [Candidatus Omnitrophica bacterium]|nr:O-antigen ligase family protein [Candidatus Omnitrophota bacterium]